MTDADYLRRATRALRLELPPTVADDYCPRVLALLDRLDAVRVLHRQRTADSGIICAHCHYGWPCPTIRALDGTL